MEILRKRYAKGEITKVQFEEMKKEFVTINQFIGTENFYHHGFSEKQNSSGMAYAYPPAVGILSNSKNCMGCHSNNGPWKEDNKLIINISIWILKNY